MIDVIQMFVQPLFVDKLDVDNEKILEDLKKLDYFSIDNNKSIIKSYKSWNNCLLDEPEFKSLKHQIELMANEINYTYSKFVEPLVLTESWATKTEPGGIGDQHVHSNSLVSGVYYPKGTSTILFHNPKMSIDHNYTPTPQFSDRNIYNSGDYTITPKDNFCLMFYSQTIHQLGYNNSKVDRYSIAFNTVVATKGEYGLSKEQTESTNKRRKIVYGV